MDVYCPKCGEPWELDSLHEEVSDRFPKEIERLDQRYPKPERYRYPMSEDYSAAYHKLYTKIREDFRSRGCVALGSNCNRPPNRRLAHISAEMMSVFGDDLDGVASMMEDL